MLAFSNDIAGTIRTTCFHEGNAVCAGDWRAIFSSKGSGREAWRRPEARADVVYIDPPYTADHYSRFYHLLEVVTDYDYPALEVRRNRVTKGRYPVGERRHHSAFCRRETVEGEFRDVLRSCSRAGAAAVVSYSRESGLLLRHYREDLGLSSEQALARFRGLALESYGDVEILERPLQHSGQGDSNIDITELLLVCRKPRKASEAAEAGGARAGRSRA